MSGEGTSRQAQRPPPLVECPFLYNGRARSTKFTIRVFFKLGEHHTAEMFGRNMPSDEIKVGGFMECTLREITRLVKYLVHPTAQRRNAKFSFAIVSRHYNPKRYEVKEVAEQSCYENPGEEASEDTSPTLGSLGFQSRDYLDVAIL